MREYEGHPQRSAIKETLKVSSIFRINLYNLVKTGKMVPVKLGKGILFTEDELTRFIGTLKE